MKAVQFHQYGALAVLRVEEVDLRPPGPQEVTIRVRAAGINPGETKIRSGALHDRFPATFPSGQGSDLAGEVTAVGAAAKQWAVGDAVLGWSWTRSSHAEYVVVPADQLIPRPPELPWEVAGGLYVAGCTAHAAVSAVKPSAGDTIVVTAAAGGVGSIATQLLRHQGVNVIAVASNRHATWLTGKGATVVAYGPDLRDRLKNIGTIDGFLDFHGHDYPTLALELGVARDRINTTVAFPLAERLGIQTQGSTAGTSTSVLAYLAERATHAGLEVPIAGVFPLTQVREAFALLEQQHTLGKIVLVP